ncbi:hypothetical protein V6N11_013847 [Hibiscus sabdariffa]|uniref:Uncharacterized protein n=1 Tax=Hibiscus sabdariffa TaxID=183260 RepID=A0ABR2N9Z4_9ROSI
MVEHTLDVFIRAHLEVFVLKVEKTDLGFPYIVGSFMDNFNLVPNFLGTLTKRNLCILIRYPPGMINLGPIVCQGSRLKQMRVVLMQFQTKDPESARAAEGAPTKIPVEVGGENTKWNAISSAYFSKHSSTKDTNSDQRGMLFGLRDKPVMQQDALPNSEVYPPRYLLRKDHCLRRGIPFVI